MKLVSTRGRAKASLSKALREGAAPDGGLYVPEKLPPVDLSALDPGMSLAAFAARLLRPFFAGDEIERELDDICMHALNMECPLVRPDHRRPHFHALELFHGPTGAFKDFGVRFLMSCFDHMQVRGGLTVLAATSGDTGAAVGCAAERSSSVRAVILFPKGRISDFQEQQLTCWAGGVQAIEVDGDFDDCQRLVKAAFMRTALTRELRLTSANSINIGRLLPPLAYAGWAALKVHADTGAKPGFIVPSGNLGHGLAVMMARALGLPVGPVVLATNANRTLKDWRSTGVYRARPSVPTLASAMDVGNPSNFERLSVLPQVDRAVRVELVTDLEIKARIRSDYESSGYVWCPHSATAAEASWRLSDEERSERPWIAAATAHPCKFAAIVNPLIGREVEPGPELVKVTERPRRKVTIPASTDLLVELLHARAAAA